MRLRCRAPITRTCAFIKALPKTLAFHWDARKTRGFGNFWPYLRTFYSAAAVLGRRLLLAHQDHVLPTDHLEAPSRGGFGPMIRKPITSCRDAIRRAYS